MVSAHNLRIETDQYIRPIKTPSDQRTCLYCPSQAVEDEMYFLQNIICLHDAYCLILINNQD